MTENPQASQEASNKLSLLERIRRAIEYAEMFRVPTSELLSMIAGTSIQSLREEKFVHHRVLVSASPNEWATFFNSVEAEVRWLKLAHNGMLTKVDYPWYDAHLRVFQSKMLNEAT